MMPKEESAVKHKHARWIAAAMLLLAVLFVVFALNHPEMSFPWRNGITYTVYGIYVITMAVLFIAPWKKY